MRYQISSIQCRCHIDGDDHDVIGDNARGDMAYGVIAGYVSGPALVICTYDAYIVTMDNYTAVMVVFICEDHYSQF